MSPKTPVSNEFRRVYNNDRTVHTMVRAGATPEQIIVQLATEKASLQKKLALNYRPPVEKVYFVKGFYPEST